MDKMAFENYISLYINSAWWYLRSTLIGLIHKIHFICLSNIYNFVGLCGKFKMKSSVSYKKDGLPEKHYILSIGWVSIEWFQTSLTCFSTLD